MPSLLRRAQRAIAVGDAARAQPSQAARAYVQGVDLLLAHCMLEAAASCATREPLRALDLLQRIERAAGCVRDALPIAASAYDALGETQIAHAFRLAVAGGRLPDREVA